MWSTAPFVELDGFTFDRDIRPTEGGDATIEQIIEAAKNDENFKNPFRDQGYLTMEENGKLILLGTYVYGSECEDRDFADAQLTDAQIKYEDQTMEHRDLL